MEALCYICFHYSSVFGEAVKLAKLRKNHKSFVNQNSSTSEAKTILSFIFPGLQVYGRHLEIHNRIIIYCLPYFILFLKLPKFR